MDKKQKQTNHVQNACLSGLEPRPYLGLQSNISQLLGMGNQAFNLIETVKGLSGDIELCEPASTDKHQGAL